MKDITLLQKAGVFALVCAGILALSGTYFVLKQAGEQDKKVFAVSGKGEVEAKANKAKISATFTAEGKTAAEANELLSKKVEKMFKSFKELNSMKITEDDIKTESASVSEKYEYCDYTSARVQPCTSNPKVIGYTASQYVTFSIKENEDKVSVKDKVSKVLGILPELEASNVNGPSWEVDSDEATTQARNLAVEEARKKAESIAASLGKKLGDVVSYNENTGGYYPVPMYATMKAMDARGGASLETASMPVSQGTDKVTVNVDITYELR